MPPFLTAEGCRARRERLWSLVPQTIEWLLIADPRHVNYLANFWINPFSFSAGERGLLLLERGAGATLLVDNFAILSAVGEPHVEQVVKQQWYDHRLSVRNRDHVLIDALKTVVPRLAGKPGLFEAEWLPAAAAAVLPSVVDERAVNGDGLSLGTTLRDMRRQKDPDEIELLRWCMRATEAGQARAREIIRPGLTDSDIYREVQAAVTGFVGQPAIVYGDFRAVNGEHPALGGLPIRQTLAAGDMFILDFSTVIAGYRSDFTNTLSIGLPNREQQKLEICLMGMHAGEKSLRAGALAKDVHAAVAAPIWGAGYQKEFWHHAGHGIGLAHPEPPILVPESSDVLQAGDVITFEPGVYVDGVGGIRIEHNYLITETGYERLSNHTISLT